MSTDKPITLDDLIATQQSDLGELRALRKAAEGDKAAYIDKLIITASQHLKRLKVQQTKAASPEGRAAMRVADLLHRRLRSRVPGGLDRAELLSIAAAVIAAAVPSRRGRESGAKNDKTTRSDRDFDKLYETHRGNVASDVRRWRTTPPRIRKLSPATFYRNWGAAEKRWNAAKKHEK